MPAVSIGEESTSVDDESKTAGSSKTRGPSVREPSIGRIGRFELKSLLGHGGFGRVYRAYDPQLDRQVALKIPKFAPEEQKKIRRFFTEAKSAARLRHPNIVTVYEFGLEDGEYFIASEYVDGRTLSECIRREQPGYRESAAWVRQLAEALAYAHEEGIIHRDIKPENIMIGRNNRPQIMDFGLAKRLDEDSSMTADGGLLGTPAYMSPEQARGDIQNVGPSSDQYSLGVVLYELLTGEPPFKGPAHSVIAKVTQEEPPRPSAVKPETPRDLQAICLKAMEKQPQDRYTGLREMAADLDRWLDGHATVARPLKTRERAVRWCRKNPLIAGLSSALLCVLGSGIVISSYFAIAANREKGIAEQERDAAQQAQQLAEDQRLAAEEARQREAESRDLLAHKLAESQLKRAVSFMQERRLQEAVMLLIRTVQLAPERAQELNRAARLNLAVLRSRVEARRDFNYHTGRIFASSFSPDGRYVATGSGDRSIRLWEAATGRSLPVELDQGSGAVRSIDFGPDGKRLVTGSTDRTVRLWDAQSGKQLASARMSREVGHATFHPEGKIIAAGDWGGRLQFFDAENLNPLGDPVQYGGTSIGGMAFSPDGKYLVSAGNFQIWDTASRQLSEKQPPAKIYAYCFAFSSDGQRVAMGGGDGIARIWDFEQGQFIGKPMQNAGWVRGIAYDREGEWIVTADEDGLIQFWDVESGKKMGAALRNHRALTDLELSPDGRTLLTCDEGGTSQLWNLDRVRGDGLQLEHEEGVISVDLSSNGNKVVTATNARLRIWDTTDGKILREIHWNAKSNEGAEFSPDDRYVVGQRSKQVQVWSADTSTPDGYSIPHPQGLYDIEYSPDRRRIATAGRDSLVRIWELETGQPVVSPLKHPERVWELAFRNNGNELVSVTAQTGEVQRWDLNSGFRIGEPWRHDGGTTWPVGLSSDASTLTLTGTGGVPTFWNWNGSDWIDARSPDRKLASNGDATFSNDGRSFLLATLRSLTLLDVETCRPIWKPSELINPPLERRPGWAEEPGLVVFATQQGSAELWDLRSASPVGPPFQEVDVTCVDIDPTGHKIVAGDSTGIVTIWTLPDPLDWPIDHLVLWAEATTGLELTPDGNIRSLSHEDWSKRLESLRKIQ